MADRFVVLGLATPRSDWFRQLGQWANAGFVPIEFVKCISAEELRARLRSGRRWSAALVDAALPALDRDLVDEAHARGCAVIVVDDMRAHRDWAALGTDAVINALFDRAGLVDTLARCAQTVGAPDDVPGAPTVMPAGWRARTAAICGPGGTGSSTAAIALAQGLGDDVRHGGMVLLADLARRAEQSMLHDAGDVMPGLQEVVDLHRSRQPPVEEVRSLTFDVPARRYQLLLGLRQPTAWSAIRPRAFEAAFENLRRGWRVVVCDVDADFEGEDDGGSVDVEERNVLARTAVDRADVVFAVGVPGLKGIHSLVRVLSDLVKFGVDDERIVPVINRAPRTGRARSELARAVAALGPGGRHATPIFLPERAVDDALRDGVRLPAALSAPLAGAFHAVIDRSAPRAARQAEPRLVSPGSIGSWPDASHEE